MRKALVVVTVVCVAAGVVLTGCSSFRRVSGIGRGTDLSRALARVAATDATRIRVRYDATGKLTDLVGNNLATGFGTLMLFGTDLLYDILATGDIQATRDFPLGPGLTKATGITPLEADYGISAGRSPNTVSVLAGGQQVDRVGSALTAAGWTRNDDRYVNPDPKITGPVDISYALSLAQVRTDGTDLVFGRSKADLGAAGHPSGKTLADDRPTRALADCLGDVVVAEMVTDYWLSRDRRPPATPAPVQLDKLTQVAVGVRTPKSASDTPRAVVCTAWADESSADAYAAAVPTVLASGLSPNTGQPYTQLLPNPDIRKVGGGAHIVEWSADEAEKPAWIVAMLQLLLVPGLF